MKAKLLILALIILSISLFSQPTKISYQGILTDDSNNLITGSRDIKFDIYSVLSGGSSLWNETHSAVTISNGLFTVELGSQTPFGSLEFSQSLWLEITVDPSGTPTVLSPRVAFNAVGYSFSGKATSLQITTNAGSGKVLTSDASGNGSWQDASGGTSAYCFLKMTTAGTKSGGNEGGSGYTTGAEVNFGNGDTPLNILSGMTWNSTTQKITIANTGIYSIQLSAHIQHVPSDYFEAFATYKIYVNDVVVYTSVKLAFIPWGIGDVISQTILCATSITAGDEVRVTFSYYGQGEAIKLDAGSSLLINKL